MCIIILEKDDNISYILNVYDNEKKEWVSLFIKEDIANWLIRNGMLHSHKKG